jgi:hypothetical protein
LNFIGDFPEELSAKGLKLGDKKEIKKEDISFSCTLEKVSLGYYMRCECGYKESFVWTEDGKSPCLKRYFCPMCEKEIID